MEKLEDPDCNGMELRTIQAMEAKREQDSTIFDATAMQEGSLVKRYERCGVCRVEGSSISVPQP